MKKKIRVKADVIMTVWIDERTRDIEDIDDIKKIEEWEEV